MYKMAKYGKLSSADRPPARPPARYPSPHGEYLRAFHSIPCAVLCTKCDCAHSVHSVHVCYSFYYCLHFILEWGKEIAFPIWCTLAHFVFLLSSFFNTLLPPLVYALSSFAVSLSLSLSPNIRAARWCINNCIRIKILNLFSSKSEKNSVWHFDFCMTQKIKIYNQIPYIRWRFASSPVTALPRCRRRLYIYLGLTFLVLHSLAGSVLTNDAIFLFRPLHIANIWQKNGKIPRFRIKFQAVSIYLNTISMRMKNAAKCIARKG